MHEPEGNDDSGMAVASNRLIRRKECSWSRWFLGNQILSRAT